MSQILMLSVPVAYAHDTHITYTLCECYSYIERPSLVLLDDIEFKTQYFQRVFQYIRRHNAGKTFDDFTFCGEVEGRHEEFLQTLLKYVAI